MKKLSYVRGHYRNEPAKKPDPIRYELDLGKELVSELAANLSDLSRDDIQRLLEAH